jgi:hypothetical protein
MPWDGMVTGRSRNKNADSTVNFGEYVMASFRPIILSTTEETLLVDIASYIVNPF